MWSEDIHFGAQRLVGCNPLMVKLCTQLPEKYVQSSLCLCVTYLLTLCYNIYHLTDCPSSDL